MTWTRHGECNECGHCCQTFTRDIVVRDLADVKDATFYRARGFQPMTIGGKTRHVLTGWMVAPCPQFNETCGCLTYTDRPKTCRDFPVAPADIVASPCSYWFERGAHKVGGTGSPYPASMTQLIQIEAQEAADGLHD